MNCRALLSVDSVARSGEIENVVAPPFSDGRWAGWKRAGKVIFERGRLSPRGEVRALAFLNDIAREDGRFALLLL
jgi:hypothetical protein